MLLNTRDRQGKAAADDDEEEEGKKQMAGVRKCACVGAEPVAVQLRASYAR